MASGKIVCCVCVFIDEVVNDPNLHTATLRLMGTLNYYNASENRAEIEHRGHVRLLLH